MAPKASNYGVSECDLLIVTGARFSDRVTGNAKKFAKDAKILQFDVDAAEMNKNILITEGVVGDLKVVLQKMNERLEQQNHKEWIEKIISYKEKYPMTYHPDVLSGPFISGRNLPSDKWRSNHFYGSRTASDVGSTVL